tara:strand:+ start:18 stop:500 length:483 start_codon:yes stop_codon:yes gene_type:complete
MSSIVLIDTSIYLNVLDVPGWNQDRIDILAEFKDRIENGDTFLLPMATIWETGGHIADLATGGRRREFAKKFVKQIDQAMKGEAPFKPTHFPEKDEFLTWLIQFPEYAMRNKSVEKPNEGVSLADMSMIMEWQKLCTRHSMSVVEIWSLDADLSGYRQDP